MNALRRSGRFNLVGLAGAAFQLMVFFLLMRGGRLGETAATAIAVEIAVLHNFFWHEQFTWRDRKLVSLRRRVVGLWRFHAANGLISLAGNMALTWFFVEWFHAPALASALAAIALCAPANFLLADRWVYPAE